jgi:folylpolyglutamate synthase/dihydrofolate synthase
VGTYSSPHLLDLGERICTSPAGPIARRELDALVARNSGALEAALQREGGALTHFEVLTALALRHFADAGAEVAVVEVGMGGARDATNVLEPGGLAAAVITPIGMEHVAALGGSIESIAAAKAGILKAGRPAVIAAQPSEAALGVLLAEARRLGCAPLVLAEGVAVVRGAGARLAPGERLHAAAEAVEVEGLEEALAGGGGGGGGGGSISRGELRLVGPHQHGNAATAIAAASVLAGQGLRISAAHVLQGLAAARLPGRFQVLPLHPGTDAASPAGAAAAAAAGARPGARWLVADGAHTAESAAALAATLRQVFPDQPVALVVAMAADKEHRAVLAALRALRPKVAVFTSAAVAGSYRRSAPPGTLVAQWQAAAILDAGRFFRCRELIQAGLASAVEKAKLELRAFEGEGVIVVAGSLHAAAEAIRAAGG